MNDHEPLCAGFRDAIHVPFIIVSCDDVISPGDKCSLRDGNKCVRWASRFEKSTPEPMWHGVADPFCEHPIPAGELFPLYLRKECFGKLRHDFVIEVHDRGGTDTCHSVCDIF